MKKDKRLKQSVNITSAKLSFMVLHESNHASIFQVLSQFEGASVVILSSAPLAEYLSSAATYEDRPSLLVRCLATRSCKLPSSLVSLEPPNVVKGTAAAGQSSKVAKHR